MNNRLNQAVVLGGVLALGALVVAGRAQQVTKGHASDFTSVEYFAPPHQQMIRSRLSGRDAQPEPGGLLVITQLRLETFDTNGEPGLIVKAPHCIYDTLHGVARSSGHLRLETADGSSHVDGDGFLWRQMDSFLTISNHVRTVIENPPERNAGS